MRLAIVRAVIVSSLAALSASCLDSSDPSPSLSVSTNAVSLSASPGEAAPVETIAVTIAHATSAFMDVEYSGVGIETLTFTQTGPARGSIEAAFIAPASLESDTYTANITVRACVDVACTRHLSGSPATVTTHYEVGATGTSTATLDRNQLELAAYTDDVTSQVETLQVTLNPAPATGYVVYTEDTGNTIQFVERTTFSNSTSDLNVSFQPGQYFYAGKYDDSITVTVCYDPSCHHPVSGSPFTVATTLTIDPASERGLEPLEFASRVALSHDVVDAEFSKALNHIVMVSANPVNAIYVYDPITGTERERRLVKPPTSVSVGPDGLTAAVGHDALISIVDLQSVGVTGAPAPKRLNVSTDVFDIVLDGAGSVHVFPSVYQAGEVHSIEIATNTETFGYGFGYASAQARLSPGTSWIYAANTGSSPSDIAKWDVSSGTATLLYDSPYHGDFAMCGGIWFNEAGTRIYTPCGNIFQVRANPAQDMIYAGSLELSGGNVYGFLIQSLSQSDAADEIAIIEFDGSGCSTFPSDAPCISHLTLYEADFLNHRATYSIRPVTIDDGYYFERGLFVFHDADGSQKYLLSKLDDIEDPDAEYYLSVIQ